MRRSWSDSSLRVYKCGLTPQYTGLAELRHT